MSDHILPSWREGTTRSAIIAFLDHVEEIPPADRVAVFDNDGTMWCEKPNYTQLEFLLAELHDTVAADPTLGERPEFQAILTGVEKEADVLGVELPRTFERIDNAFAEFDRLRGAPRSEDDGPITSGEN